MLRYPRVSSHSKIGGASRDREAVDRVLKKHPNSGAIVLRSRTVCARSQAHRIN
jgi:hypothetical protein